MPAHANTLLAQNLTTSPLVTPSTTLRVFVYNVRTGTILQDLPYIGSVSWSTGINATGNIGVQVPVGGTGISQSDIEQLSMPWKCGIGVSIGARVLQAGPILTESFDDTNNTSQLTAAGMWQLFNTNRVLFEYGWAYTNPGAVSGAMTGYQVTFSTDPTTSATPAGIPAGNGRTFVSYATVAKRLVQLGLLVQYGDLPIVFNADDAPGTASITYLMSDFKSVGQCLSDLTQLGTGPEICFAPEFTDNTQTAIRHRLNIGSWESGDGLGQSGFPWSWDYQKACPSISYTRDGTNMTNQHFSVGNGQEAGTLYGTAVNYALPQTGSWPVLENADRNHTSESSQAVLNGYANLYMQQNSGPQLSFEAKVTVDGSDGMGHQTGSPDISQIREGDTAWFSIQHHPRIPNGVYATRILGISNDGASQQTAVLSLMGAIQTL